MSSKVVKISEVVEMWEKGMTRKEIAEELGITMTYARATVFSHPALKGKKQKSKSVPAVIFEDDLSGSDATVGIVQEYPVSTEDAFEIENADVAETENVEEEVVEDMQNSGEEDIIGKVEEGVENAPLPSWNN